MGSIKTWKYVIFCVNNVYSVPEYSNSYVEFEKRSLYLHCKRTSFKNAADDLLSLFLTKEKSDYYIPITEVEFTTFIQDNTGGLRFLQNTLVKISDKEVNKCIWEVKREKFIKEGKNFVDCSDKVAFICAFGPIGQYVCDSEEIENVIPKPLKVQPAVSWEGLSLDLSNMLETENFSDVVIKCGEDSFPAHKNILSARSPVFAAMFRHDMSEQRNGTVSISDIESEIFSPFLKYLYSGKLPVLSKNTAVELYKTGDKYAIAHLKKDCIDHLRSVLAVENVFEFLILANFYNEEQFKENIMQFIKTKARHILKEDSFRSFRKEHPMLALELYDACND